MSTIKIYSDELLVEYNEGKISFDDLLKIGIEGCAPEQCLAQRDLPCYAVCRWFTNIRAGLTFARGECTRREAVEDSNTRAKHVLTEINKTHDEGMSYPYRYNFTSKRK